MAVTLFQMRENLQVVGNELREVSNAIRTLATDPSSSLEEVRKMQTRQGEIQESFNLLKKEIGQEEEENRKNLMATLPGIYATDDEQRMKAAKAEFIRAGFSGRELGEETRNLLGAIPAPHASGGEKLLPTNMQNELVSEPMVTNPLRQVISVSSIKGLEIPKIAYTLDDDDFIVDGETAKELELKGDKATFGRHKMKIYARITDTVMHGTDLDLTGYVQNALNSGLAAKEKKVMLTETPKTGEEHMSFYSSNNQIKKITGADLYKAIKSAIADLHESYRENAKILMRYVDYMDIIETLANNNATLYTAQPEQILGKPVIFCDSAIYPIVGDFNYARLNYDGSMVYDNDKDVKAGDHLFVITAWYDVQLLLKSAFRLAMISA